MSDAGLLDDLVLVGSWCLPAYRDYFGKAGRVRTLRTRDMDFLVPLPSKIRKRVDVAELLEGLGFVMGHRGTQGFSVLQHPELLIEFLVPERGKGHPAAYDLPMLGVRATPLRFMDIALTHVIDAKLHGIDVRVPHPANFALHKLLVAPRRREAARRDRDAETAAHILELLLAKGETTTVLTVFGRFPKSWQRVVLKELVRIERSNLTEKLGLVPPK